MRKIKDIDSCLDFLNHGLDKDIFKITSKTLDTLLDEKKKRLHKRLDLY